jgi:two-component system, OmpR family, response regulator
MNLLNFNSGKKPPITIFIIEDNEIYSKALVRWLQQKLPEAETVSFKVGELAVDSKIKPNVIIVDYHLNANYYDAADGLTIVNEIRGKWGVVPVIMLTSQMDVMVAVKAAKLDRLYYVQKDDHSFEQVIEMVKEIV